MQDEVRGILSQSISFPQHRIILLQRAGPRWWSKRLSTLYTLAGGCHAGTAMLQLRMPSSTPTLTEPAHPTPRCRTFIILGLFCGFEGFSVTEGHKRSTHTLTPGHTQLYTQSCKAHMCAHTHFCTGTHTCSHTIMHRYTCMYTHSYIHSCTTATHIITRKVMLRHIHM